MGNHPHLSAHRKRDRLLGLTIIVFSFAGCMGLSVWGMRVSTPKPAPAPSPVSQEGIPGYPNAVRPFAVVERARGLTVRQKFQGFEAEGVRRDGTVDVTAGESSIRLAFQSPQGRGPQPEREPGTLPDRRYCGTQSVIVDSRGISALEDRAKVPCGGRDIVDLATPKACTIEDLWAVADKKKMGKRGTARVEYFNAHGGPAFRFVKDKRSFVISARDCKKELKGRDQRGGIPRR